MSKSLRHFCVLCASALSDFDRPSSPKHSEGGHCAARKSLGTPASLAFVTFLTQRRAKRAKNLTARNVHALLLFSALLSSCQSEPHPVPAGALIKEYEQSITHAREKYDGKEISVRGLALAAAVLPLDGSDQGSVWLEEFEREPEKKVGCWFSQQQVTEFSKIKGGQRLIIKGVFNGEAGINLKFCRLVKVE